MKTTENIEHWQTGTTNVKQMTEAVDCERLSVASVFLRRDSEVDAEGVSLWCSGKKLKSHRALTAIPLSPLVTDLDLETAKRSLPEDLSLRFGS